ncbi:hypothetical protein BV25DRAFT_1987967 [Artomyces pyxidatus]|uniref:Uncharacterized protein n=1 Tax=Artomyces pyxidatus TaxID=48021 RepID=A0ACB8TEM6_9AGAM|nr:hypothetical protein BV25DRAFT_1987967 [Artomyces pyxidatus]
MSFTTSFDPQPPFPTSSGFRHPNSGDGDPEDGGGISRNSLGIIFTFVGAFLLLVAFGLGGRHIRQQRSRALLAEERRKSRRKVKRPRPKMSEVRLDDKDRDEERVEGRLKDWQPIAAWVDKEHASHRNPPLPQSQLAAEPYHVDHHIMMSQAWFRGVYAMEQPDPPPPPSPSPPPSMHVALLIAMPSEARSLRAKSSEMQRSEEQSAIGRSQGGQGPQDPDNRGGGGDYFLGLTTVHWQPEDTPGGGDETPSDGH